MPFRFDQPVEEIEAPEGTTFENAGDLKFSDLGPPPERVATEEGNELRQAADAEALWTAKCSQCGVTLPAGKRVGLLGHVCTG